MNDDIPEWAFGILIRHDLLEKTDTSIGGVIVLLEGAGNALQQAATTMAEELATTPDMVQFVRNAAAMVVDAIALTSICNAEPQPGVLERQPDGSYIRRPLGPDEK